MRETIIAFVQQSNWKAIQKFFVDNPAILGNVDEPAVFGNIGELIPEFKDQIQFLYCIICAYRQIAEQTLDQRSAVANLEYAAKYIENVTIQFPDIIREQPIVFNLAEVYHQISRYYKDRNNKLETEYATKAVSCLENTPQEKIDGEKAITNLRKYYNWLALSLKNEPQRAISIFKKVIQQDENKFKNFKGDDPSEAENLYTYICTTYVNLVSYYQDAVALPNIEEAIEDTRKALSYFVDEDSKDESDYTAIYNCISLLSRLLPRNQRHFYSKLEAWLSNDAESMNQDHIGLGILSIYQKLNESGLEHFHVLCDFNNVFRMVVNALNDEDFVAKIKNFLLKNPQFIETLTKISNAFTNVPSLLTITTYVPQTAIAIAEQMKKLKQEDSLMTQQIDEILRANQQMQEKLERIEQAMSVPKAYSPTMNWVATEDMEVDGPNNKRRREAKDEDQKSARKKVSP